MGVTSGKRAATPFYRLSHQKGVTFFELLIVLGLLSLFLAMMMPTLHFFLKPISSSSKIKLEREITIFWQQFEREVQSAQSYLIEGEKLHVWVEDSVLTFERYQDMIRRQLGGSGHLVLAQHVQGLQWMEVQSDLFEVRIVFGYGSETITINRLIGLKVDEE